MSLQVGYAQETITPTPDRPVYLAGFGQNRKAQSVHDDLYVRALALQQGETRLVLAGLDLIGLVRVHCLEIEHRVNEGAPSARVIVACTHVHHGPDTIGLWGPDNTTPGVDPEYLAYVKDATVSTILVALSQTQPSHVKAASTYASGVTKNTRDPYIVDDELTCLQFCAPEGGATRANLLIFPCHPEVLWDQNSHITSDYPASLRREVEAATRAPCLFLVGALGGMMTPDVRDHSFEEAETMGKTLAEAALRALSGAQVRAIEKLEHARREYAIPMTNPAFQVAVERGLLPNALNAEGAIVTETNLLKIGPAWLVSAPGELLPKLGLALKVDLRRASAECAGVVSLANDELGYILPQEDFVYPQNPFDPGQHYEETMSVGLEAGPRLMAAARALISETL